MNHQLLNNDFVLSAIKKVFSIISGLISISLINRYLGPELKGQYAIIMNDIEILFVIMAWGYVNVYTYEKKNTKEDVFNKYIAVSITEFLILSIIGATVILFERNLTTYCIILPIYILSFQLNHIFMVENMKMNTLASIIMHSAYLFGSIFIFFLPRSVSWAFAVFILKEIVFVLVSLALNIKRIHFVSAREIFTYGKHLLKIGFLPMLTTLLVSLNYKLDVVFLKMYKIDYYQIGLYSLGLNIAQYIWIIPDIFKDVLIKRSATKNFIRYTSFSLRMCSGIIATFYFVMLVVGRWVIRLIFGIEYLGSYPVVLILIIGSYTMVYTKLIGTIYYAEGLTKKYFFILSIAVGINIILNTSLIPYFDIYGAAISTIVSYSISGIMFMIDYSKKYDQKVYDLVVPQRIDFKTIFAHLKNKNTEN